MLKINDLKASIFDNQILNGINLEVKPGEVHAIMGPNGSGKSTLASVLAGREQFEVNGGSAEFLGEDLLDLNPEDRARKGLFLAFQYPVEIPGVSTTNFLKSAVNQVREYRGQEPMDAVTFLKHIREKMELVNESVFTQKIIERRFFQEERKNEMKYFKWPFLNLN